MNRMNSQHYKQSYGSKSGGMCDYRHLIVAVLQFTNLVNEGW